MQQQQQEQYYWNDQPPPYSQIDDSADDVSSSEDDSESPNGYYTTESHGRSIVLPYFVQPPKVKSYTTLTVQATLAMVPNFVLASISAYGVLLAMASIFDWSAIFFVGDPAPPFVGFTAFLLYAVANLKLSMPLDILIGNERTGSLAIHTFVMSAMTAISTLVYMAIDHWDTDAWVANLRHNSTAFAAKHRDEAAKVTEAMESVALGVTRLVTCDGTVDDCLTNDKLADVKVRLRLVFLTFGSLHATIVLLYVLRLAFCRAERRKVD